MKYFKRISFIGVLGLALLLIGGLKPAEAASCSAGSVCTVHLTNSNVSNPPAGLIDISVTIDNQTSATNSNITVAFVSSALTNTPLGIDQFGYASTSAASTLPTGFKQANCGKNGCNLDGFGALGSEIDNPGGTNLSFSFQLASLVTNFAPNSNGTEFAAHIRFNAAAGGSCSLFASDGTSGNSSALSSGCTLPTPESGSLSLLGLSLGIIGVGFFGRKINNVIAPTA
jgi:hypothetical protein